MAATAEQSRRDQWMRRAMLRRLRAELGDDVWRRWWADARNDYDKERG